MSRRRAKKPQRPPEKPHPPADDTRGAEALTVFWMLTLMATLAAEVVAGATALFFRVWGNTAEGPSPLAALPGVMLFTALCTGTLCLLLTVVVRRVRRAPAPTSVVWTAVAIGLSPWLALLVLWAAGSC